MFTPETLKIGVALVRVDDGRLLVTWNDNWGAFALPMSKCGAYGTREETPAVAAVRAAAEALVRPCRAVPGGAEVVIRKVQLSARDGELRNYDLTVVPVEVHPDYAPPVLDHRPVVLAQPGQLLAEAVQPVSDSMKPIMEALLENGQL